MAIHPKADEHSQANGSVHATVEGGAVVAGSVRLLDCAVVTEQDVVPEGATFRGGEAVGGADRPAPPAR